MNFFRKWQKIQHCISPAKRFKSSESKWAEWKVLSDLLPLQFISSYTFAVNPLRAVSAHANQPIGNLLRNHVDHVTINVTNKKQCEVLCEVLKRAGLLPTKKLIFDHGEVEGTLYWLPNDSELYRSPGEEKGYPAIQGVFFRYFPDDYLKNLGIGQLADVGTDVHDVDSLLKSLNCYKPPMLEDHRLALVNDNSINLLLRAHLANGTRGHLAIDLLSIGTSIASIQKFLEQEAWKKQFSTLFVKNPQNTIRQLYLAEPEIDFASGGIELEPFLELIEREEIESVSAIKSTSFEK